MSSSPDTIQQSSKQSTSTGNALQKIMLSSGKFYIRSEAPSGYLQNKFCHIGTHKSDRFLFEVVKVNGYTGFRSMISPYSNSRGDYLAVSKSKGDKEALTFEEKEHFTGRLFLLENDYRLWRPFSLLTGALNSTQFELFVPPSSNADTKSDNVRAIIQSVSTQRFVSVKSGGNPFATEKDPNLATIFVFEREPSKSSSNNSNKTLPFPSPGIYHIRVVPEHSNRVEYLAESQVDNKLVVEEGEEKPKALFRLSYNKDGTISLFSLALNEYVCVDFDLLNVCFKKWGRIARFELRQQPSGAVRLVRGSKFLSAGSTNGAWLTDTENFADSFKFIPADT